MPYDASAVWAVGPAAFSLTVAAPEAAALIAAVARRELVSSLADLAAALERRADRPPGPPVLLDLVGRAVTPARLLRLGGATIDLGDARVEGFFRRLAASGIPRRLGIAGVRLLADGTALSLGGRHTMRRLAAVLGLPVHGTVGALSPRCFGASGFDPGHAHLLVEAGALSPWRPRRTATADLKETR
jgi:hypothetical protein